MHTKLKVLVLVVACTFCSVSWSQTPGAPVSSPPMKRDVFFVLMKSSLNNACDNPQSPYACMVKNVETCRKNLPIAVDQCEKKMKGQLPSEIESEESRQWSTQVARCIVDDYILLAGAANLDPSKCPSRR